MADGITCVNNQLSLNQWLMAILNQVAETGCGGIRVETVTADNCSVISCNSHDSFFELLKRSTSVTNGYLTLRIAINDYQEGDGLVHLKTCSAEISLEDQMRGIFCEDASGNVAIQLFNIT